jgi:hypothetical protein
MFLSCPVAKRFPKRVWILCTVCIVFPEQTDVGNVMEDNEGKDRTVLHFRLLQLDDEGNVAQNGCYTNEVMKYVAIPCCCSLHVFS